jgi:hypothetical protein
LFIKRKIISRTDEEWYDSTIQRRHIQRKEGSRKIYSQSARQETSN